MLIVKALNVTGGTGEDADGLSDYDCKVLINWSTIFSGRVVGHIRTSRASELLRRIADAMDEEYSKAVKARRRGIAVKNKRPGRKPKRGRHAVHYDTVPHNPCYDPQHCDCECSGCMTAYANWLARRKRRKPMTHNCHRWQTGYKGQKYAVVYDDSEGKMHRVGWQNEDSGGLAEAFTLAPYAHNIRVLPVVDDEGNV
jgi:hypothetical protein